MKRSHFHWAVSFLVLAAPPCSAADLGSVSRALVKEPVYQSKSPRYCLLAFGRDADVLVWLVLDGDVMYIDRNGNGDLTEAGERVPLKVDRNNSPDSPLAEFAVFEDHAGTGENASPDVAALKGTARYTHLAVSWFIPREGYAPKTEELREHFERIRGGHVRVRVRIDHRYEQVGEAGLAGRPQDAAVLHFDGPLTFGLEEYCRRYKPKLVRGAECRFGCSLITPGRGKGAFTMLNHSALPEGVHPVADIEFPAKWWRAPIREQIELTDRC